MWLNLFAEKHFFYILFLPESSSSLFCWVKMCEVSVWAQSATLSDSATHYYGCRCLSANIIFVLLSTVSFYHAFEKFHNLFIFSCEALIKTAMSMLYFNLKFTLLHHCNAPRLCKYSPLCVAHYQMSITRMFLLISVWNGKISQTTWLMKLSESNYR